MRAIITEPVRFEFKASLFGNPVTALTIFPDHIELIRKKTPTPQRIDFGNIGRIFTGSYFDSNANYNIMIFPENQKESVSFSLDQIKNNDVNNCEQTRLLLAAYCQYLLTTEFPANLNRLSISLSLFKGVKAPVKIQLANGILRLEDGREKGIDTIRAVRFLPANATSCFEVVFDDGTNLRFVADALNANVLEAIMANNSGHQAGVDYSKGNLFDAKNSYVFRERLIHPMADPLYPQE